DWLKLCTPKFANRKGQDITPITDVEKKLIEIIKYNTKVFTEPDMKKVRYEKSRTAQVYVKALNNILLAMKGKRIFDRFGFDLPKEDENHYTTDKVLVSFNE